MFIEKYIKQILDKKPNVYIFHNNDTGVWCWSVCPEEDETLWLDSFETKELAIDFCKRNKLTVLKYC